MNNLGPGGTAIQSLVDRVDGGPPVQRYRPSAPHRFRSGGPLRAVTVHRVSPPPHWHLVTYGLTELDVKESDNHRRSGWGFELTFRVAPADDEPDWASDFLTNLAAYVWQTGHGFAAGDHLDLRGPVRLGTTTTITAAVVVRDPALGVLRGPFGRVEFLQLVGLRAEELELCRAWSTDAVVGLLAEEDPLLVTALDRRSLLEDPARRAAIDERRAAGRAELRIGTLQVRQRFGQATVIRLGAGAATALGPALRRTLVGRDDAFRLIGDDQEVRFVVAEPATWTVAQRGPVITVPLDQVDPLASLFNGKLGWGRLAAYPGLRFQVVK